VAVLSKGHVVYDGPVAGVEGRLGDLILGRPAEDEEGSHPEVAADRSGDTDHR